MRFPTIYDVTRDLCTEYASINWAQLAKDNNEIEGETAVDVRLQVLDGGAWFLHSGDASYDTDHHGFWGASCIAQCDTRQTLTETARDLISQARDMKAQGE